MNTMSTMTDYPITPTSFRSVELRDSFWLPRLETTRTVTIPDVLGKCEEFGRVDNFRTAARREGSYRGKMPFEDRLKRSLADLRLIGGVGSGKLGTGD